MSGSGENADKQVIPVGSEAGHWEEYALVEFPVREQSFPVVHQEIPCSRSREFAR
jgi:hypothetical protein